MKENSKRAQVVCWMRQERVKAERKFSACIISGILVLTIFSPTAVWSAPSRAPFRGDRLLVKPRPDASAFALTNLDTALGCRLLRQFPRVKNWRVLTLPHGAALPNIIAAYQRSGLVLAAEPDYLVHPLVYPNDLHFQNGDQWNLINLGQYGGTNGADIHITNVWNVQTSASNVIVALADTGIRYTHEDLAANMWHNPQENTDGYTNDLYGINLTGNGRGNGDPWDDHGHGTHVAGIIGAVGNNGVGIAGICWSAQLMALKFIDTNGNGAMSDAITCLDFAASHGANVINASWGGTNFNSQALHDAVAAARNAGIIVVAAAGNSGYNNDVVPFYPADYSDLDNVIAVAASDRFDQLAPFSDYGATNVDLAAPGTPIYSCWNGSDSDYRNYDGTSMAAANVTGACALLLAHMTNADYHQIISRLYAGVDPLPGLAGKCVTGGRLNVQKAFGIGGQVVSRPVLTISATNSSGDLSQGVSGLRIFLSADPNQTYVLEAATNMMTAWTAIATNQTAANGTVVFTDPQAGQYQWRFYRALVAN